MGFGLQTGFKTGGGTVVQPRPEWVFFAGGQSNATSTWADAIQAGLRANFGHNRIHVVRNAFPGNAMYQWYYTEGGGTGPQANYFSDLAVIEAELAGIGSAARFGGFFWFQGEGDCNSSGDIAVYANRFNGMLAQYKTDLALDTDVRFALAVVAFNNGSAYDTDAELQAILGPTYTHAKMDSLRAVQVALGGQTNGSYDDTAAQPRTDAFHLTTLAQTSEGGNLAEAWYLNFGDTIV